MVFQLHGKTYTGRLIPGAPRNIRTVFYYTPHLGEDTVYATAVRSNCAGSVGHADTSLRAGTIEFDPVPSGSVGPANSAGAKKRRRIIFEWCCGEESKIGIHTEWSDGCEVIRITVSTDVTTKEGLASVIAQIKIHEHDEILLWGSIPCTGGAAAGQENSSKGKKTLELIQFRIRVFMKIWTSFVLVAELVLSFDGTTAIEWPKALHVLELSVCEEVL